MSAPLSEYVAIPLESASRGTAEEAGAGATATEGSVGSELSEIEDRYFYRIDFGNHRILKIHRSYGYGFLCVLIFGGTAYLIFLFVEFLKAT